MSVRKVSYPRPALRPEIRHKPGMADDLMRELAPFLAEEGIDLDRHEYGLETLQQALTRAVERRNHALFTPTGRARDLAVEHLRATVRALLDDDIRGAGRILDSAVPESPDGSVAENSACIGVALTLLDTHLTAGLGLTLTPPAPGWPGRPAARDLLTLAAEGRAFESLRVLMVGHGGQDLHYGGASALAAVTRAWSVQSGQSTEHLILTQLR
jgi:hypothetical protein